MSPMVEAVVFLRSQVIDDKDGGVVRVRRSRGLSDNDRVVGRVQGIYDASEGLENTTEAARIWGQRRRLWRRYDRPE